jgi:RNA polymerase sigma-70 factor, ECF subfamily
LATDREIWDGIVRGETASFEELYRCYAPRMQRFLYQAVRNRQASEDLTQDTFTQIWRKPNGYDPARGPLATYLFGICRKRAAQWWRQQRPSENLPEDRARAESNEAKTVMAEVFSRLPEEQRSLLWLREIEGQSYAELAAILDVPIGTVRSRLFAAREALRKIWLDSTPLKVGRRS